MPTLGGLGTASCRHTLGPRGRSKEQVEFTSPSCSPFRTPLGLSGHRDTALCAVPPGPPVWVRGRPDLGAEKKTNTDVFGWDLEGESRPRPHPTPTGCARALPPLRGFPGRSSCFLFVSAVLSRAPGFSSARSRPLEHPGPVGFNFLLSRG